MPRRSLKRRTSLYESLWRLTLAGAAFAFAGMAAIWLRIGHELPDPSATQRVHLEIPMRVYTSDCYFIGEFGERRRWGVDYEQVPQHVIDAFLAAEDHRFFAHGGVSVIGLMRAVWDLVRQGEFGGGGGTITMQVARNYIIGNEVTILRKLREILYALVVEQRLSKERILELYFNGIFFGNRAYGMGAAAAVLFGKPVEELTVAEGALIAALPKAPTRLNPVRYPYRARVRRDWILGRMRDLEMISSTEATVAIASDIDVHGSGFRVDLDADYVAELARASVVNQFGLRAYRDGYKVYTTIHSSEQSAALDAIHSGLRSYDRRKGWREPVAQMQHLLTNDVRIAISQSNYRGIEAIPELDRSGEIIQEGSIFYPLRKALDAFPQVAGSEPAMVLQVRGVFATLMTAEAELVEIKFSEADEWARLILPSGRRTGRPQNYEDIIEQGDVVYIQQTLLQASLDQVPLVDGALVSLDANTGGVRALVGGYDFRRSKFNRATQAKPLLGSVFKPFLYAMAVSQGYSLLTEVLDAPYVITDDALLEKDWRPRNDDGKFKGTMTFADAFAESRNLVSIRLLNSLGIEETLNFVDRFGFDIEDFPHNLSLALGTAGATPLQVAQAFAAINNGGDLVQPFLVDRVEDPEGRVVWMEQRTEAADDLREMDGANKLALTLPWTTDYLGADADEWDAVLMEQALGGGSAADPEFAIFSYLDIEGGSDWHLSDAGYQTLDLLASQGAYGEGCTVGVSNAERSMGETSMRLLEEEGRRLPAYSLERLPREQTISPELAWMTRHLLRGVVERGTGTNLRSIRRDDLIGKTGTSNDATSTWFAGSFGSLVTAVWVGFDDSRSLGNAEFGSTVALPIWQLFAEQVEKQYAPTEDAIPLGIARVKVKGDRFDTVLAQYADTIEESVGATEEERENLVKGIF